MSRYSLVPWAMPAVMESFHAARIPAVRSRSYRVCSGLCVTVDPRRGRKTHTLLDRSRALGFLASTSESIPEWTACQGSLSDSSFIPSSGGSLCIGPGGFLILYIGGTLRLPNGASLSFSEESMRIAF